MLSLRGNVISLVNSMEKLIEMKCQQTDTRKVVLYKMSVDSQMSKETEE